MKVIELLENENLPIFRAIYPVCADAHKDQKRKDGKPYMTHVDAVIEGTYDQIKYYDINTPLGQLIIDRFISVAAAHDVIEDQPDKVSIEQLRQIFDVLYYKDVTEQNRHLYKSMPSFDCLTSIQVLSKKIDGKKTYVDYADYVYGISRHSIATAVKIADLKHNMSDLSDGNLKEKYQLTLAVLEGQFC